MLISLIFIGLVFLMQAFPDTAVGRGLRRWLVEAPARKLNFLTPKLVIGVLLMTVVVGLLAQVVPVGMALALAGDVGAYMEIVVAVTAVVAGANARRLLAAVRDRAVAVFTQVHQRFARSRAARSSRRVVRPRRSTPPDPEHRGAWMASLSAA